jgi:hypothetical protein
MKMTLFAAALVGLVACGDNTSNGGDDTTEDTTSFRVRIKNIAPWTVLESGRQGDAPLDPGASHTISFHAGNGHAISFATMLGESNDWFFAPGPGGIPLYDEAGTPRSGDVTSFVALWDAGTEVDQEPAVGNATAPRQPSPNFGAEDPDPRVRELGQVIELDDGTTFVRPATAEMIRAVLTPGADREFTLTITNVSEMDTLVTSIGSMPSHLSPLAWGVHAMPAPLFSSDAGDRGEGLERIAEDGDPTELGQSLAASTGAATPLSPGVVVVGQNVPELYAVGAPDFGEGLERIAEDGDPLPLRDHLAARTGEEFSVALFDTAAGASEAGPALPGHAFELVIDARPGDRLELATMFGMSNDWFFATMPDGVSLFDGDDPIAGDVTAQIALYDAGTEIDQRLAIGADTAPQQIAPNTGAADPIANVRQLGIAQYPRSVASHLRVQITPFDVVLAD